MKKIFMIMISIVFITLVGLGMIGYCVEKDKAAEEEIKIQEEIEKDKNKEDKMAILDVDKLDINKIEGYTAAKVEKDENKPKNNFELPYKIKNRDMEILSIGSYKGKFVEDGSDEEKDNVLSMVVKNTSKETISYGEINLKRKGTNKDIKFIITNLKPGAAALVMESTGKMNFLSLDDYVYSRSIVSTEDNSSYMEEKISLDIKDNKITVKNMTEENLNTVYIYYKNISSGNCYLGGTTYRIKFENVKGQRSVTSKALHFSKKNSEIVKIESVFK